MNDSLDLRNRIQQMRKSNNLIVTEKKSINNNLMSKFESSIKDDNHNRNSKSEKYIKKDVNKEIIPNTHKNNSENITQNKDKIEEQPEEVQKEYYEDIKKLHIEYNKKNGLSTVNLCQDINHYNISTLGNVGTDVKYKSFKDRVINKYSNKQKKKWKNLEHIKFSTNKEIGEIEQKINTLINKKNTLLQEMDNYDRRDDYYYESIQNFNSRISGALLGACLFYIITNFGVWSMGSYGYNLEGLILSYTLAIPFFGYSLISTFIFSAIIECLLKLNILNLGISK